MIRKTRTKLKGVQHRSKLRIDVNPNQRNWNYKVKIQKKKSGKWKTVKTTRTKGAKDIRIINRKKGKYRVITPTQHCNPVVCYKGSRSRVVKLRR